MKRIIFEITSLKEGNLVKFIKEIDKLPCNIEIDFDKNIIAISNISEDILGKSIELLKSCYKNILKIKMENTCEENKNEKIKKKEINNNIKGITVVEKDIIEKFKPAFDKIDKKIGLKKISTTFWTK